MSSRKARITLQSAVAPFVSTQLPRPVIQPELDNAGKVPRSFFSDSSGLDYNAVSVNFYENVMPVTEGWQTVNYADVFPGPGAPYAPYQYLDATEFYFSDPLGHATDTGLTVDRGLISDSEIGYHLVGRIDADDPSSTEMKLFDRMPLDRDELDWTPISYQVLTNDSSVGTFTLLQGQSISWAMAGGVQFFCVPGTGIFFYGLVDNSAVDSNVTWQAVKQFKMGTDVGVTATGDLENYQFIKNLPFEAEDIMSICAAQGYLVVAAKNQVAWALLANSVFDFEEYANGSVTGSGVRIPEELQGEVTALRAVPGGFIAFSEHNAVGAFYSSSNFANPWNFRRVSGCGGLRNVRSVSSDNVRTAVFAVTSVGLQQVTLSGAQPVDPAFDDYLSGKIFELYDYDENVIRQLRVSTNIIARCTLVGSRYVLISCGVNFVDEFEIAYVYDLLLKRWGKLRAWHGDALQLSSAESERPLRVSDLEGYTIAERYEFVTVASLVTTPNVTITESRQKIGIMLNTGQIRQVLLGQGDESDGETEGIVRVSPVRVSRSKNITLHTVEVDGQMDAPATQIILNPSYDGRTWEEAASSDFWTLAETIGDRVKYGGLLTMHSAALTVRGKFDLSTLEIEFSMEGDM